MHIKQRGATNAADRRQRHVRTSRAPSQAAAPDESAPAHHHAAHATRDARRPRPPSRARGPGCAPMFPRVLPGMILHRTNAPDHPRESVYRAPGIPPAPRSSLGILFFSERHHHLTSFRHNAESPSQRYAPILFLARRRIRAILMPFPPHAPTLPQMVLTRTAAFLTCALASAQGKALRTGAPFSLTIAPPAQVRHAAIATLSSSRGKSLTPTPSPRAARSSTSAF